MIATTTDPKPDLLADYQRAGLALAQHVSIVDRIKTDPDYSADRSPRAWAYRERDYAEALAKFRESESAFLARDAEPPSR
jgi:hypothetical protein